MSQNAEITRVDGALTSTIPVAGPLSAQSQDFIERRAAADLAAADAADADAARAVRAAWRRSFPTLAPELPVVVDTVVESRDGHPVPVRVYRDGGTEPLPVIVFLHGGGWVLGDLDHSDAVCRCIAQSGSAVVVNVDYRLAPEHRYPTALEDTMAVLEWAATGPAGFGIRPASVIVLGCSAGGELGAAATLALRDAGAVAPIGQVLFYPVVDPRLDYDSYREFGDGSRIVSRDEMAWYWRQYAGDDAAAITDPYAAPVFGDLTGLPRALVITAEHDPLRDEGEAYAVALAAAGVPTRLERVAGSIHGFLAYTGTFDVAMDAVRSIDRFVRDTVEEQR